MSDNTENIIVENGAVVENKSGGPVVHMEFTGKPAPVRREASGVASVNDDVADVDANAVGTDIASVNDDVADVDANAVGTDIASVNDDAAGVDQTTNKASTDTADDVGVSTSYKSHVGGRTVSSVPESIYGHRAAYNDPARVAGATAGPKSASAGAASAATSTGNTGAAAPAGTAGTAGAAAGTQAAVNAPRTAANAAAATARKKASYVTKRFLALTLVIAVLLSTLLGALLGNLMAKGSNAGYDNLDTAPVTDEKNDAGTDAAPAASGGAMTVGDVISANEDAVVEINTQIMQQSMFGSVEGQGAGSGVIVKDNGYIVTNYHVIEDSRSVSVILHNSEEYSAQVVGYDEQNDIAVLKIAAEGLTSVKIGKSSDIKVGDQTVAIGNPLGQLGGTATSGIISALDRKIDIDGTELTLLQTDTAINPGNSGGGLFDMNGNLIGIVVAKSSGTGVEGLGFAIPIDTAAPIIDDLITNGTVTERPAAGITIYSVPEDRVEYYGVDEPGVYIGEVNGKNAKEAGLKADDRIIALDGEKVESSSALIASIQEHKIGDEVTFTVKRGGREMDVTFALEDSSQFTNN